MMEDFSQAAHSPTMAFMPPIINRNARACQYIFYPTDGICKFRPEYRATAVKYRLTSLGQFDTKAK